MILSIILSIPGFWIWPDCQLASGYTDYQRHRVFAGHINFIITSLLLDKQPSSNPNPDIPVTVSLLAEMKNAIGETLEIYQAQDYEVKFGLSWRTTDLLTCTISHQTSGGKLGLYVSIVCKNRKIQWVE
jgi:hypothetical protein